MTESFKLGTIIELVASVKRLVSMSETDISDGLELESLQRKMLEIANDRKALIKFGTALKVAHKTVGELTGAPMSFVGGFLPSAPVDVESMDPAEDVPVRVRKGSGVKGEIIRPKKYGKKEDDE